MSKLKDENDLVLAPLKSYYKWELAELYEIAPNVFGRWIKRFEKELKKLFSYKTESKILTIAEVEYLFSRLGRPYKKQQ
jgi:hypothetical protein